MEKAKFKKRKNGQKADASPKRHTHRTSAGLEDAIAILMDISRDIGALLLRADRALEVVRKVREGPHSYDPETPAGLRVVVRKHKNKL